MDLRKIPKDMRWIFKQQKDLKKLLKPQVRYFEDVDILSIWFGGKGKVESSVEVDDILFDFNKQGVIIGLEIQDFSNYLKKRLKK